MQKMDLKPDKKQTMRNESVILICFALFGLGIIQETRVTNLNAFSILNIFAKPITSHNTSFIKHHFYRGKVVPPTEILFHHHGFKDFSKGSFSDAGENLYVSRNGNIQFVNLFDLNADGYPEVVINNDHNFFETPDALVYHNRQNLGLHSLINPNARDAPAYQNLSWTLESLSSITRLPTEGGGKSVFSDLNLDGYKDLVFVNFIHGSTLAEIPSYIYWGGSDGLNPLRRSLLPADRGTAVAVDDVTGDGLPDIVISNSGREHLGLETPDFSNDALTKLGGPREKSSYFFRQTEAGFTITAREVIPTSFAIDVKIADLDNDGKKELVFLELGEPGSLRIVEQKDGKWTKSQLLPVIAPKPLSTGKRIYQELLVKDLNGDGYADIFAPSSGSRSEIFWNNKGEFSSTNRMILDAENAMSADAEDLNKDGIIDLVIANFFSKDKNGKPYFETNSYIWWGRKEGFSKENRTALPTLGAVSVRLADLNNTGNKDILFAQHRNQETHDVPSYIYLNSPNGFFAENRMDLQGFGAVSILADDLDVNGRKEVILISSLSGMARQSGIEDGPGNEAVAANGLPMYIYRGNPNKNYGAANLIRVPESSAETNIAFADLDDNGKAALVHLRGGGYRLVIRYDVYNYPVTKELTEIDLPFRANTVNVADYDRDGILDILVTPIMGSRAILFFGLGNRKYRSEIFDFPHYAYSSAVGDVNNDGLLDAVTASHKEICILIGSKLERKFYFKKPQVITTDVLTTRVSLADFNKDGWLDILSQNLQNTYTKVYDIQSWVLINDKGSYSLENKYSFATFGANGGSIAQLWNDGKMEVVISNYHADASRRVGTFVLKEDIDGFPSEKDMVRLPAQSSGGNMVMDFNGDGNQDILVFNHTGNEVYNGGLTPTGGIHGVGSVLYWGGKNGYGLDNKTWIPSFGPHSRIMADPGSIGRRNPFEVYTSAPIRNTSKNDHFKLTIAGRFNKKQFVTPEIIIEEENQGGMSSNVIPLFITDAPGSVSYQVTIPKGKTFRYRLKFNSSNSGSGPIVSSVVMEKYLK